jgi:hypothetical protein
MERLNYCSTSRHPARRGVLLLLVLSLLTLFMMLGATYLVIATRARATARAFANAMSGAQSIPTSAMGQAFVDEAFLRVVRGSAGGSSGVISNADTLLGDKYGLPSSGTATTGTIATGSTSGTIIITTAATVSGTDAVEALSGRVLTFTVPGLTNASTRILRAEPEDGHAKLFLPAGPTLSGVNLTAAAIGSATATTGGSHFVINGREFTSGTNGPNEAWDGYDSNNDFLANPLAPTSRPSFSTSGAIGTSGANLLLDNDGDGVLDSGWLDVGLPPIVNAAGQTLYPRAAILITDLDGRLNVNAHGSRSDLDNPAALYSGSFATGSNALANITSATTSFATLSLAQYPRGRGIGPAEIALESSGLFESGSGESGRLIMTGVDSIASQTDSTLQRTPPKVGAAEGRYGGAQLTTSSTTFPRPGTPYTNDSVTSLAQSWMTASATSYFTNPVRYGSPPDLKASTSIFLDDFGQPVYYRPYWASSGSRPTNLDDESIDDPYEINLSRLGPRSGALVNPATRTSQTSAVSSTDYRASAPFVTDNLFTAGDLEGLLRAYDIDSPKLSRRLPAICGTKTGENRLLLTTDSWDTSAMTGPARAAVSRLIAKSSTATGMTVTAAMSMFAPETLMGQKLDLNRPFHDSNTTEPNNATGTSERLSFAKHFYCLAFAIAGNGGPLDTDPTKAAAHAREIAQWAINVVDFRDADSVMTGFEYDTDITDGWSVNGNLSDDSDPDRDVVWGIERPELLITETVCWHDRNTDDLTLSSNQRLTAESNADTDFDQARRPRGAFFFELFSPWDSQAAEYDQSGLKAVRRTVQGGTSSLLRAEPLPAELLAVSEPAGSDALARFDAGSRINLSGTSSSGGYPVWRLATFTNTSTGTTSDPLISTTATAWRTFYFRQPPLDLVRNSNNGDVVSGTAAVAYWPSSGTVTVGAQSPIVFGTGTSPSAVSVPASFVEMNRLFLAPTGTSSSTAATVTATLTEPAITSGTNASYDPYAVLHTQALPPTTVTWPLTDNNVNPRPLDDLTYSEAGITAQFTGPAGDKTLFQNGRHSNFFTAHLQRLANPNAAWNSKTNPYVTIDAQPIDLLVFNTLNDGKNYDEPCGSGSAFVGLASKQRPYDDADTAGLSGEAANVNVERGKTEVSGTNDRDIWAARVNPNATGFAKLLTISASTRNAIPVAGSGNNKSLTEYPAPVHSGTSNHSLGKLSPRFVSSGTIPTKPFPWLVWNNRPFISAAELSLVPRISSFELLRQHCTAAGASADLPPSGPFGHLPGLFEPVTTISSTSSLQPPWPAIAGRSGSTGEPTISAPSIWDAVHVPTPFGGSYQDVPLTTSGTADLSLIGLNNRPYGQLPHFREPGRVNMNTITGSAVWTALLGSGTSGTAIQSWTPGASPFDTPARTLLEALGRFHPTVSGTTSFVDTYTAATRNAATNANFRYQTVNRLTNLSTIRSNVFAVWVTIGYSTSPSNWTEAGSDTGEIRRHRGFYIYDRSIPVGFDPGKDLNVRDAILLRRIIQ